MSELHPPFMNYMGPGTKIEDRLSLNYKGKKGTKNYFIPTTYSDLVSFEHDLLYWSPDNVIKAYADAKFINDIRSIIGYAGIVAQYTRRLGIEGIYNYGVGVSVLSGIKSIYKDFINAYKTGKDVIALTGTLKELKQLDKEILERARRQFGDLIRTPAHIQKNILEGQQLFEETKQEVLTNREIFARNVAFRLLPKLVFTAYLVAPKVIKSSKELLRNALTFFVENPEYSELQKRVDKVKDKYEKYLNEAGKACCDQILKASDQMLKLVENLNAYIVAKESPLNIESIRVEKIINLRSLLFWNPSAFLKSPDQTWIHQQIPAVKMFGYFSDLFYDEFISWGDKKL